VIFNTHSHLAGQHAFLGPSKYHWINYDPEKLDEVYLSSQAAARGVQLHAFAHDAVRLGIKLPRSDKTLNSYVNDAIGFRMVQEQILYYSENCFGTADTIMFRRNMLRIHDLKSGVISGSMHQVEIYAALFCLEYGFKPGEIEIELRIYQNDEILVSDPEETVDIVAHIMSKIVVFDRRIELLREAG
jgi:hypothetical protein